MTRIELFDEIINNPWKLTNELLRLLILPLSVFYSLLTISKYDFTWKLYGLPIFQINKKSRVLLGKRMELRSSAYSNPLTPYNKVTLSTRSKNSLLTIGDDFAMTGGSVICATTITIGNRVKVGANVVIMDTDFHPIRFQDRKANINNGKTAPIIIEDDVFIGTGTIILKGTTLGKGSVIGAASVVTKDVEPNSIYAGNPARKITKI